MKKIVIVLMVLFTVGLTGGLYHTLAHLNTVGQEMTGYAHTELPLPAMSDMTISLVPVVPLY